MNIAYSSLSNTKASYVPGIDGLRALAVLSVILFHFNASILPGGFSGVDVFFVISGYVVSGSLAKERQSGFWHFAVNFYARRITRIYPALVVCLVFTGFLQALLVPNSWLSTTSAKTAISAFFGLSNFALIWFSDGYFSPRVEFNAFTHTWSLAVEEQFYLLFPIVFFIWMKGRDRKDVIGIFSNWLLPILLAISLLFSWYQTTAAPDHAYYLLPSRFWELACGAMLFKLHARGKLVTKSAISTSGCVIVGLTLISLGFFLSEPKSFPFPWAMMPVGGALFVIAAVTSEISKGLWISKILSNVFMVYVGKISYSLYLWHWPIAVIFRWTVGLDKPLTVVFAILLTTLASIFSYHVIEKPIRQSRFAISRPDWYIVSCGLMVIVASSILAIGIFKSQPYLSLSVTKDTSTWYPDSRSADSNKSPSTALPFHGRTLYVLGDSHTGAYSAMLEELKGDQGVAVHQYSKGGCSVANLLRDASPECVRFIEQTVAKIRAEATPGDIVFLASLRMNRLGDQWETFDESAIVKKQQEPVSIAQRAAALLEAELLIESLEKASLTVVIDAPKPVFKSPPFRCSDWFNARNPVCDGGFVMSRRFLLEQRQPVMNSIQQLSKAHPGLVVWDPFPVLCPMEPCTAFDKNLPLFFDGDHLSGYGNRVLYPSFLSLIKSIWRST